MKKSLKVIILMLMIFVLAGCGAEKNEVPDNPQPIVHVEEPAVGSQITTEMAFEGVNNYCHETYNWDETDSNMYVTMGEESETEYQVIFRSYTGAYVYFYVNRLSGITRMVEYVPTLEIEEETGTINIYDYLTK